ncbi:MAG: hypothetical protein AAGJ29_12835, partial [Pseudomonadota bacterium]
MTDAATVLEREETLEAAAKEAINTALRANNGAAVANAFDTLSDVNARHLFFEFDGETQDRILSIAAPDWAALFLEPLPPLELAFLLERLEPGIAADIIDEFDSSVAAEVIEAL